MKKIRILKLVVRIGLSTLILSVGTVAALILGETTGFALADLSQAPVQAMTTPAHNDVLYVVLNGGPQPNGIYRSEDNGHTWQVVGSWSGTVINTMTTDPTDTTILYAGTAGGPLDTTNNVWRSEDGGRTWRNFNLPLPASPARLVPAVTAVVADPNRPEVLYVGTSGQGVYRFEIGQIGYRLVGGVSLLSDSHIKSMVMASDSRLYALTNTGLFVTAGDTWHKLETVPEVPISLAIAQNDPQVLYVGGPTSGAYRSLDGGQAWASISDGLGLIPGAALRITALAVDEQDSNHLVAATAYGVGSQLAPGSVYESRNAGSGWAKLADTDGLVNQLILDQGVIYAATTTGLAQYGELNKPGPIKRLPPLHSLTNPTGIQMLILILTVGLASLALLSPIEWILNRGLGSGCHPG
jgi:photosystem II stability/assembly factor-like uncharacterized protein